jgi:hypothetical protein
VYSIADGGGYLYSMENSDDVEVPMCLEEEEEDPWWWRRRTRAEGIRDKCQIC